MANIEITKEQFRQIVAIINATKIHYYNIDIHESDVRMRCEPITNYDLFYMNLIELPIEIIRPLRVQKGYIMDGAWVELERHKVLIDVLYGCNPITIVFY